jgi:hypothetical protein
MRLSGEGEEYLEPIDLVLHRAIDEDTPDDSLEILIRVLRKEELRSKGHLRRIWMRVLSRG